MDTEKRKMLGESFLEASDGQFLGKLCLNEFDSESVTNRFGQYGSQFSATSINNSFSVYGSPYSALSPNNPFTTTPPRIYLRGQLWGTLTVNGFIYGPKISPLELNKWMHINGLFY